MFMVKFCTTAISFGYGFVLLVLFFGTPCIALQHLFLNLKHTGYNLFLPWSVCHDHRQYRCFFSWTWSELKIGSAGVGTGVGRVVGVRRGWDHHYSSQEGPRHTAEVWDWLATPDCNNGLGRLLLLRAEQRRQKLDCWLSSTDCKTQSSLKVPQLIVKRGLPEVIPQLVEHWLSH